MLPLSVGVVIVHVDLVVARHLLALHGPARPEADGGGWWPTDRDEDALGASSTQPDQRRRIDGVERGSEPRHVVGRRAVAAARVDRRRVADGLGQVAAGNVGGGGRSVAAVHPRLGVESVQPRDDRRIQRATSERSVSAVRCGRSGCSSPGDAGADGRQDDVVCAGLPQARRRIDTERRLGSSDVHHVGGQLVLYFRHQRLRLTSTAVYTPQLR